jgi:choline dehydrogenase-like flavoprotein
MTPRTRTSVLVVGSGPGGAAVARELARGGRQVLLLERGRDWRSHPLYGTYAGALLYADRRALLFTREGLNIIRPLMLGGATSMYAGCAADPRPWWHERYGIDLAADAAAFRAELGVAPLAPALRGAASTRVAEAAGELGMAWQPQDKFLRPARAREFDCGAHCMLGCRCGAKWTAAELVDEAVAAGAEVWTGARAEAVRHEGGAVHGVRGVRGRRPFEIEADTVILAAGGLGTPALLRASGFPDAGRGLAMDTTAMVYGFAKGQPGMGADPPMTWSAPDDDLGVLYSTLIDPWLMYPIITLIKGPQYPLTWHRWGSTYGVMIKLTDEVSGGIDERGRISKGLTARDRERLEQAEHVARRILVRAGCAPGSIFTSPLRGTHPSATVRIDDHLDRDLRTAVKGLYVCDASVFPEALGRPTVLTILALARRLARTLLSATPRAGAAAH